MPAHHSETEANERLRLLARQYALVFFVSDPRLAVLFPEDRAAFLASPLRWAPAVLSIGAALLVATVTFSRRIPVATVLALGLVFEVVGSFGIAAAQYLHPNRSAAGLPWIGLSWVAVWMLGFSSSPAWKRTRRIGPATAEDLGARLAGIQTRAAWTRDLSRQGWSVHHPRPIQGAGPRRGAGPLDG